VISKIPVTQNDTVILKSYW